MAEFVTLTGPGDRTVHVNMDRVEYIKAKGRGAMLVFTRLPWVASDRLDVREAPDEIVRRANGRRT